MHQRGRRVTRNKQPGESPFGLAAASSTRLPAWTARWSRQLAPITALVLVAFGVLLASGLYDRLIGELGIVTS